MKGISPVQWGHIQRVMAYILRHPGATMPRLARETGLAPSAVHGMVTRLEAAGVIRPGGTVGSAGGRRATCFEIRPDAGCLLGVCLRAGRVELGVFDMALAPQHTQIIPWQIDTLGPETAAAQLAQAVDTLLAEGGVARERVVGVGINVPGPVDGDGMVVEIPAAQQWRRYPLRQRLAAMLGLPVNVDKDVYAGIRYLEILGEIRGEGIGAFLSVREGIGAALMLEGRVLRGAHNMAGEIGHITVRKDGIPCPCGNVGCLELYCSETGIVAQYNAQAGQSLGTIGEAVARLDADDEIARRVFSQAVAYLVEAIASLVMNYDPQALLIDCPWLGEPSMLYARMLDTLYAKSVFTREHTVDIRLLNHETRGSLAVSSSNPINLPAAAALALEDALSSWEGWLWRQLTQA